MYRIKQKIISKTQILGFGPILIIILAIILSFLLIHLLSVFGIFLAFAYPIWWLFASRKVPCFFCRIKKDGQRCLTCRQIVHRANILYPKTFYSALANTILLLVISFACMVFVFAESKILFKLGFPPTPKTVSFIIP